MILLSINKIDFTICCIIIVLCMIAIIVTRLLLIKNGKNEVKLFLSGLADEFYKLIIEEIAHFNQSISQYESVEEYYEDLLKDVYDMLYNYTIIKAEDIFKNNAIIHKFITKEVIEELAKTVIEKGNIKGLVRDNWSKYFEERTNALEEVQDVAIGHDVDGNEIIYSGDEYYEDFTDQKYESPSSNEEIDKNALSEIIPPSEDENTSFSDDVIMEGEPEKPYIKPEEPISEEELPIGYVEVQRSNEVEDLPYFIDKHGRKRDKLTGRYIK